MEKISKLIEQPRIIEVKPIIKMKPIEQVSIENNIWVTARGIGIPVKGMSTGHINNTIKCFNGEGFNNISPNYLGGKEKWLNIFNNELVNRN